MASVITQSVRPAAVAQRPVNKETSDAATVHQKHNVLKDAPAPVRGNPASHRGPPRNNYTGKNSRNGGNKNMKDATRRR